MPKTREDISRTRLPLRSTTIDTLSSDRIRWLSHVATRSSGLAMPYPHSVTRRALAVYVEHIERMISQGDSNGLRMEAVRMSGNGRKVIVPRMKDATPIEMLEAVPLRLFSDIRREIDAKRPPRIDLAAIPLPEPGDTSPDDALWREQNR